MKGRWWISWLQPTEDYRPLNYPPNGDILGWWCSGYNELDVATLCALVKGKDARAARKAIRKEWPEAGDWRFENNVASDWLPGDRFPLTDWMRERLTDGGAR